MGADTRYRVVTPADTGVRKVLTRDGQLTMYGSPGPRVPDLYWSADYATKAFSQYAYIYPDATDGSGGVKEGTDYGLTTDPDGSGRTVAWFDNYRGLTHGNANPRVAMEAPRNIKPRANGNTLDTYWYGVSFRVDGGFSDYPKDSYWLNVSTAGYGAPYAGTSPMSLGVWPVGVHGKVRLVVGNAGDLNIPYEYQIDTDAWYTIVTQFRFAYSPQGWMRMWIAKSPTGEGLAPLPVKGQNLAPISTMSAGINDGWYSDPSAGVNSSRVATYSAPGSRARVLFGHHKLAAAAGAADFTDLVCRP